MPRQPANHVPRRSRWWVRLVWWLAGLMVFALLVVGAALGWLWQHQTEAVNGMLQRLPMPVTARIHDVKVSPSKVAMKDITLHDPTTKKKWLHLNEVTWTPEWKDLPRGVIGTLHVKGATVDLDRTTLDSLTKPSDDESTSPSTPFALSDLKLEDIHVKIAADGAMPALEFDLTQEASNLDGSEPQNPSIKSFATTLRNIVVGADKEVRLANFKVNGSLKDGALAINALECGNGSLTPSKALLDLFAPAPKSSTKSAPSTLKSVELHQATLTDMELLAPTDAAPPAWWPQVKGKVSGTIRDLTWDEVAGLKMGPQKLTVTDLELKPPTGPGRIAMASGSVHISGEKDGKLHILRGELDRPIVDWTPELEAWFMPSKPPPTTKPTTVSATMTTLIDGFIIHDATLSLKRTPKVGYDGSVHLDLTLHDLSIGPAGWSSTQAQALTVSDLSMAEHPASKVKPQPPFAKLQAGSLEVIPNDWNTVTKVKNLTLQKPFIRLRNDNVSWFNEQPPGTADEGESDEPGDPLYERLQFDHLEVDAGDFDLGLALPQPMELRSKFSVSTDPKSHVHRFDMRKVKGLLPRLAKLPVAGIEKLEVAVQLPAMWKTKRIDELSIKGMELEVGDALMTLGKELEEAEEKEDAQEAAEEAKHPFVGPPEPSPLRDWRMGKLSIDDVAVTLQRVAPGLPPMKFDITYDAEDVPLDVDQLAGNFKPQRIELTQLAIKSPYNPLREVAKLDTVFVEFTLDGLLKERIDQIEIVSPTLYVGEDLFWYIDYYRKFTAGQTLPKAGPEMAAVSDFAALEAATAMATAPAKEAHAWTINTLAVHAGKLIIAPKGTPLPGFPRPFPFSFVSKLDKGQIEAEFDIPSDTYTWQELKIALEGMSGHVLFNLPVKGQDNNLTETFNVDRMRFDQLHLEKAHLAVTYDVNGIYGKFGSAAYEGYVNGAFNVYLDQTFSWDGWISGVGVKATEITQKLTPAYFLLDGKVDLTLVMQGNMNELYQADVKFTNSTPGRFSIKALNDALKSLPPETAKYQQDIMRIGVETLRDFDYQKVDGQCRFYGREGKGHLRFLGPYGSRNIELNVYDHRWNSVKPKPPSKPVPHADETE